MGHYPYPEDAAGKPIDTPEWREANDIKKQASSMDSALIKATRNFDNDGMGPVDKLIEGGADVNAVDKWGFTPLHLAIKSKNNQLALKLIGMQGVDVNAKTKRGFTPVMTASWKGDLEILTELINKGADLHAVETGIRNAWGVAHDWHKEEWYACVHVRATRCTSPHAR